MSYKLFQDRQTVKSTLYCVFADVVAVDFFFCVDTVHFYTTKCMKSSSCICKHETKVSLNPYFAEMVQYDDGVGNNLNGSNGDDRILIIILKEGWKRSCL